MNRKVTIALNSAGYTPVCNTPRCPAKGCKGCKLSTAISVYDRTGLLGVHTPTQPLYRAISADAKWQLYTRNYREALKACPDTVMYLYTITGIFIQKFLKTV